MDPSPFLHSRIADAFDDQELRTLCFDRFPTVYREFTTGMAHGQMVGLLLDYCVRHNAGDALLDALEQERPGLMGPDRGALLAWLDAARFAGAYSRDNLTAALHQLRAPVGDFVGRADEIAELVLAARSGAVAAISGIRGLGGIGKTELAYVVAHQLAPDLPDAQIVLDLRGASDPLTPVQALQTVIRAFEREARLSDDVAELQAIYRSLLTGKRVLILADDARDAVQVRPLLPPPGCALLVTSRQRFALPGMIAIDLGTLAPSEAEALLLAICPRIGEAAPALAKLCGFLPLALRISAGLLASDATLSVARYLERLANEWMRLVALRDGDDPALNVDASLALSYAALSSAAQSALCQLSVFVADFDLSAAQAVVMLEEGQIVDGVLGDLYRCSLLDYDARGERYSLHDLVRVAARVRLDAGVSELLTLRYAQYYVRVAESAQQHYLQGGESTLIGLGLFDRERTHIDAGWTFLLELVAGVASDELLIAYADATAHISDLRYDLRRERVGQLEAALAAAQRHGRRREQGRLLSSLGTASYMLGEVQQAIELYEQCLEIAREVGDRRGQGVVQSNLGLAYAAMGEIRRAIELYQQQLEITREVRDRRGEGNTLANLGSAYYRLGEMQQAIEYYQQCLEIAREVGDRRGEGVALGGLGNAYADLGEVQRGIDSYKQWLDISREVGDRRREGQALGNLGSAYYELGEVQRAINYFEQQLVISREIGDRQAEALGSWNLGRLLAEQGELARAIVLMQVCVDYELSIGHADAEAHAAEVEELRAQLQAVEGAASPEGDAPEREPPA